MIITAAIYWIGEGLVLHNNPFAALSTVSWLPPVHDMMETTFFKFNFAGFAQIGWLTAFSLIISFCIIDMFDTTGMLVGTAFNADMVNENGNIQKMKEALMADSVGTISGACTGTPTVTTYIESAAGIAVGGRTGLTALITGIFFLAAIFLSPIAAIIPPAATSVALIYVGITMLGGLKNIDFHEPNQLIPLALMLIAMPFTGSVATAIAMGLISYTFIEIHSGRGKQVPVATYVITALFAIKFCLPF